MDQTLPVTDDMSDIPKECLDELTNNKGGEANEQ